VIEWLPMARDEVVKGAVAPLRGTVPSVVAPSLNVTVPVGVPEPLTVAVKVTDCPNVLGLREDVSVVFVAPAVVTVVVTVAALLAGLGSEVVLVTVAVFVMTVPAGVAALTFAVNANVAVAPLAKVAQVAITVPVPPTGGVVNVAAGPEV
jgi:hypothetical protein